jgi:hypothetical protein
MRDWIGFNKDSGTDVMAKVGQWNLAVAVRALAEAVQDACKMFERKLGEFPPIAPGRTYDVVLRTGKTVVGEIQECGPTWITLIDKDGASVIVQVAEAACFVEKPGERPLPSQRGGE